MAASFGRTCLAVHWTRCALGCADDNGNAIFAEPTPASWTSARALSSRADWRAGHDSVGAKFTGRGATMAAKRSERQEIGGDGLASDARGRDLVWIQVRPVTFEARRSRARSKRRFVTKLDAS